MRPLDPCAPPDLRHLRRLTDSFGIVQHTERDRPRVELGYALDDVARALIVVIDTARLFGEERGSVPESGDGRTLNTLTELYLRFIEYCQRPDGLFHNFVSTERVFRDDVGSLDSYGRTLWALGTLRRSGPRSGVSGALAGRATGALLRALPHAHAVPYLRAKAFSLLGLTAALDAGDPLGVLADAAHLVTDLLHAYEDAATDDWPWFEDALRYSNGALPYALLVAAGNPHFAQGQGPLVERARAVGLKSLNFLLRVLPVEGVPAPVGNRGWYRKGSTRALYDQQAVDTAAVVVACAAAFTVTKDQQYRAAAETWWSWFFGNNTRKQPLYRPEDGAVYDGLMEEGTNEDRGAESVLAFLLAHLALTEAGCGVRRGEERA